MNLALEPLVIRRTGFSPVFRYSCLHSHSHTIHHSFTWQLHLAWDAPLPHPPPAHSQTMRGFLVSIRGFGGVLKPRYIVGAEPLDQ